MGCEINALKSLREYGAHCERCFNNSTRPERRRAARLNVTLRQMEIDEADKICGDDNVLEENKTRVRRLVQKMRGLAAHMCSDKVVAEINEASEEIRETTVVPDWWKAMSPAERDAYRRELVPQLKQLPDGFMPFDSNYKEK